MVASFSLNGILIPLLLLRCWPCLFPGSLVQVFDGHGGSDAARYLQDALLKNLVADRDFPEHIKRGYGERLPAHRPGPGEGVAGEATAGQRRRTLAPPRWRRWSSGRSVASLPPSPRTSLRAWASPVLASLPESVFDRYTHQAGGLCTRLFPLLQDSVLLLMRGLPGSDLSQWGKAVEVTQDHRAQSAAERARVMAAGGTVVEDYLNDKLAVTRALGDWHMEVRKRNKSKG